MSGFFFKAVVQLVLLFGAELWVVTLIPGPGGAATDGESPAMTVRQELVVYLDGGGKSGGGVQDSGCIYLVKV